ncbi:hypothetical protein QE152_g15895 [Popillia japonica]|uniref:Uncharacterized protein n=1 Tax=Popillia japonica TaxID=7064 RepID=A0AAW1L7Y5_POPJA
MGASSSTSAGTITIDKKIVDDYVAEHDSTVQDLLSVKNLALNLQKQLNDTQTTLNIESKNKYALQSDISEIQTNLLKTEKEKAKLSQDLKETKSILNQLQIKYNILFKRRDQTPNKCNSCKLQSKERSDPLEKTMFKLTETKNDLEQVLLLLNEEIGNIKNNQEVKTKYLSIEEKNDKLEKDLRENWEEFVKMKKAYVECIKKNRDLEDKCKVYEEDVKKLEKYLSATKLEMNNVRIENKNLQLSDSNLSNELKEVKKSKLALKEEIYEREKAINTHKDTIIELEDKLRQSNSEFLKLKNKIAEQAITDEILQKIIEFHRQIEEMQSVISTKRDFIVTQIKENDHSQREMIEKLKSDYDNCEKMLLAKDITINRRNFIDNYAKYKHLSQRNDDNHKDVLKRVYQIESSHKKFQRKYNTFSEKLYKSFGRSQKSLADLDISLLVEGLTEEKELCQDVLRIAKEEITLRQKFLQIEVEAKFKADKNSNRHLSSILQMKKTWIKLGQEKNWFLDFNRIV